MYVYVSTNARIWYVHMIYVCAHIYANTYTYIYVHAHTDNTYVSMLHRLENLTTMCSQSSAPR